MTPKVSIMTSFWCFALRRPVVGKQTVCILKAFCHLPVFGTSNKMSHDACFSCFSGILIEFINSVPKDRLVRHKMQCINDLVHSPVFLIPGQNLHVISCISCPRLEFTCYFMYSVFLILGWYSHVISCISYPRLELTCCFIYFLSQVRIHLLVQVVLTPGENSYVTSCISYPK